MEGEYAKNHTFIEWRTPVGWAHRGFGKAKTILSIYSTYLCNYMFAFLFRRDISTINLIILPSRWYPICVLFPIHTFPFNCRTTTKTKSIYLLHILDADFLFWCYIFGSGMSLVILSLLLTMCARCCMDVCIFIIVCFAPYHSSLMATPIWLFCVGGYDAIIVVV